MADETDQNFLDTMTPSTDPFSTSVYFPTWPSWTSSQNVMHPSKGEISKFHPVELLLPYPVL